MIATALSWLTTAIPESARKWVLAAVAVIAVALATLWYRGHVYDLGVADERIRAQAAQAQALADQRARDQAVSAAATSALRTQLKEETDAHKLRETALQAALASAGADNVRLTAELTRLHNDAVSGRRPGTPGDSTGPGKAPGAAQGTVTVQSGITLADLMKNDEDNYTICRKNAKHHQALLDWYNALRNGDKAGQDRAVAEAAALD